MVVNELMFAVFNAAASGMAIFLVAAGLTLIFGLLRLLNMAQGGFFMIGAYTAYSVMGRDVQSLGMFLFASLVGGVVVALLGLVTDRLVLKRLRNVDPHYVLIATFALLLEAARRPALQQIAQRWTEVYLLTLSRLLELEALAGGIRGKRALWRAKVRRSGPRLINPPSATASLNP